MFLKNKIKQKRNTPPKKKNNPENSQMELPQYPHYGLQINRVWDYLGLESQISNSLAISPWGMLFNFIFLTQLCCKNI